MKLKAKSAVLIFLLPALAAAAAVPYAESERDLSLYEVGIAVAGVYTPDYPASSQSHAKFLPVPYFVYRGNILRADREGTRARLFRSEYVNVELSAAASFAARSSDDDARTGMPNLDYLFELGPRLSVPLSSLDGYGKLLFFLPLRTVFSTDFSNFHERGFTLTPALYARLDHFYRPDWIWISQLSANFANRQLSAYFYDVAPEFVTPTRSFYDAHGGYLGTDWFNGLAIPFGEKIRVIAGVQIWNYHGSANEASPLFRREMTYTGVVGVAYTFYTSKRMAKRGVD